MLRAVSGSGHDDSGFRDANFLFPAARKTLGGGNRVKGVSKRCRKCSSGCGVRLATGLLCGSGARAEAMLSCLLSADVVALRKGPGVLMT